MRLMLLLEHFPPDVVVSALRMQELVDATSRHSEADIRIVVHSLNSTSQKTREVRKIAENVSVVRYELKYFPQLLNKLAVSNPLTLLITTLIAIREVREYTPDCILTTVPAYTPSIAAYLVSLVLGKRYCIDIRDDWVSARVGKWMIGELPWYKRFFTTLTFSVSRALFIKACKRAFLLSTVYESLTKDLERHTDFETPVVYVPNGINLSELEAVQQTFNKPAILRKYGIPVEDGLKYVIYVGTITGYYKPVALIKPLRGLLNEGKRICYIIVGGGDPGAINREIETEGLQNHVFVLGKITHNEALKLLLASDAAFYALSSAYPVPHALGVKILEYVACRLPILAVADEHALVTRFVKARGIGIALGWDELLHLQSSIERLVHDPQYKDNIDAYYPDFFREFERRTNSEKWYQAIIQNYQRAGR